MSSSNHRGEALIRTGVLTYVSALLLIAAFTVAFHFITTSIVHHQESTAHIIDISERQRMLSQRIAKLSLERAIHSPFRPAPQTLLHLNNTIDLMERSHAELVQSTTDDELSRRVYFSGPWYLDNRIQNFILRARILASRPNDQLRVDDPELIALENDARQPMLNALNAAVDARETASETAIAHLQRVNTGVTLLMLALLVFEAVFLYRPLFRRLGRTHKELVIAGRTDPLTGALNRRAFTEEAQRILTRARATGETLSVLMIDIDRFKSVNDRFGHATGDRVITAVVHALAHSTRSGNTLCRMGGEEFAIILDDCFLEAAVLAAEGIRRLIAETPVPLHLTAEAATLDITVSIGAAVLRPADPTLFTTLSRADQALYRAKINGRNRVETEATESRDDAHLIYPQHVRP